MRHSWHQLLRLAAICWLLALCVCGMQWILVLAGTADSTVEDWRDAFSTLVANVTKNNMDQAGPGAAGT